MLLSFTPNPCLERIVPLDAPIDSASQRVDSRRVREVAGGKGLNAARVAARLGTPCAATGWFGRDRVHWFRAQMEAENIEFAPVEVDVPTRVATQYRHDGALVSEVVESGHALSMGDGLQLLKVADELLPRAKMALIGGSYPPGEDNRFDSHATLLCAAAARHNVPMIYDGRGRAWKMALRKSPPWCAAPNLEEAATLVRGPLDSEAAERRAIEAILGWGVHVVLLSCGERGAYLGTRDQTIFLSAPRVQAVSGVGCGDALVGAFAHKYLLGADETNEWARLHEALRWGVAAGAANAQATAPGEFGRAEVEALLPQVQVQRHLLSLTPR
jgi:1-phosphofructokinase family hexose kinase